MKLPALSMAINVEMCYKKISVLEVADYEAGRKAMFKKRWMKGHIILFIFYFLFFCVFPMDAFARAGGGRSSGSSGSRSSVPPRFY